MAGFRGNSFNFFQGLYNRTFFQIIEYFGNNISVGTNNIKMQPFLTAFSLYWGQTLYSCQNNNIVAIRKIL